METMKKTKITKKKNIKKADKLNNTYLMYEITSVNIDEQTAYAKDLKTNKLVKFTFKQLYTFEVVNVKKDEKKPTEKKQTEKKQTEKKPTEKKEEKKTVEPIDKYSVVLNAFTEFASEHDLEIETKYQKKKNALHVDLSGFKYLINLYDNAKKTVRIGANVVFDDSCTSVSYGVARERAQINIEQLPTFIEKIFKLYADEAKKKSDKVAEVAEKISK